MNKSLSVVILLFVTTCGLFSQKINPGEEVYLIVRGDDIGFSHAANVGCIESYKNGIMRSVELMPACPWFPEAVKMLKEVPELDVGIHLALTSEWSNMKWRPLTNAPSITDEDGYFYPMVWKNESFPPNSSIQEADWKIEEIEKELRAQIELTLKYIPYASHAGIHMAASKLDPRIGELMNRLRAEYNLEVSLDSFGVKHFDGWGEAGSLDERIENFTMNLEILEPGVYLFVDHPAVDTPEMQSISHKGYEDVAQDRDWVTRVLTSERVKQSIVDHKINLISYKSLKNCQ
jgi:predicted glycoside hydrolase/deacetylase ChbG (UPF0249 family)